MQYSSMRDTDSKIMSLKKITKLIRKLKAEGKKIVLAHGDFDLMHYGHIYHLEQSKKMGDVLVVSVVENQFIKKGPKRPVFSDKIRTKSIASLGCVDYVIPCREIGPFKIVEKLRPHIFTKGNESLQQLKEPGSGLRKIQHLMKSLNGKMRFTQSLPIHSTELLKRILK